MSILDAVDAYAPAKDFRRVGRYKLPHVLDLNGKRVQMRRPSSAGKILDDESNLVDWQKCIALVGASKRPDYMALVSVLNMAEHRKQIREYFELCLVAGEGDKARNLGVALHAMLDLVDRGADWEPSPLYAPVIDAYKRMLDRYGLVPVDIECTVVNDQYRCAGTIDRRYRTTRNLGAPDNTMVPIGVMLGADTKTGQTLEYASGSYATQLAAYVDAVRYNVQTDEREPFDPPTYKPWALIVHLNVDDARSDLYWVDMNAGREGLALSERVREWRQRTDLVMPARPPLRAVADDERETAPVAPAPVAANSPALPSVRPPDGRNASAPVVVPADPPADVADLAGLRTWLRMRIEEVRNAGEAATNALLLAWPDDTPGLKYEGHTVAQLHAISEALWKVEAEYSLPFPPPLPVENEEDAKAWRNPADAFAMTDLAGAIATHPRRNLVEEWVSAYDSGVTRNARSRYQVVRALVEFANLPDEWQDNEVREMLDGTLRAIGYDDGIKGLHSVSATNAADITSAAFAIQTGIAMVLYDERDRPVVRQITT